MDRCVNSSYLLYLDWAKLWGKAETNRDATIDSGWGRLWGRSQGGKRAVSLSSSEAVLSLGSTATVLSLGSTATVLSLG